MKPNPKQAEMYSLDRNKTAQVSRKAPRMGFSATIVLALTATFVLAPTAATAEAVSQCTPESIRTVCVGAFADLDEGGGTGSAYAECDPIGTSCAGAAAIAINVCASAQAAINVFPDAKITACGSAAGAIGIGAFRCLIPVKYTTVDIHAPIGVHAGPDVEDHNQVPPIPCADAYGVAEAKTEDGDPVTKDMNCSTEKFGFMGVCSVTAQALDGESKCVTASAYVFASSRVFTSWASADGASAKCVDDALGMSSYGGQVVPLESVEPALADAFRAQLEEAAGMAVESFFGSWDTDSEHVAFLAQEMKTALLENLIESNGTVRVYSS